MLASLACAVHCALMPLVLSALPLVLHDERLEWGLVGLSAGLGVGSLTRGYRKHRRALALGVLGLGLALLVSGRFAEEVGANAGLGLVVLGGLLVALAHFLNHRLSCASA
jgi:MerC mercury resistance protein